MNKRRRRGPVLSGLIYGGVVYLVMNFVILPLSGVPHPRGLGRVSKIRNGIWPPCKERVLERWMREIKSKSRLHSGQRVGSSAIG